MALDNVPFPVEPGTEFAGKNTADGFLQGGVIADADGTLLRVGGNGSLLGSVYNLGNPLSATPVSATTYTAGQQIGGGVTTNLEAGCYRVERVRAFFYPDDLMTTPVLDADNFGIVLLPFDSADEPLWGDDGDPLSFPPILGTPYAEAARGWQVQYGTGSGLDFVLATAEPMVLTVPSGFDRVRLIPYATDSFGPFAAGAAPIVLATVTLPGLV